MFISALFTIAKTGLVFLFVVCLFFPYLATSCGVPGARDQIPATGETHTTVWGNTGSFNPRCQAGIEPASWHCRDTADPLAETPMGAF